MSRGPTFPQTRDRALGMVEMLVLAGWQREDAERQALTMTIRLEEAGFVISRAPASQRRSIPSERFDREVA